MSSLQSRLKNDLVLVQSIDEDYQSIQRKYESDVRQCIAHLYQDLEWLHPFPDGQGRTDLLLLSKITTDYGLHPPILDEPYASSILPFKEWDKQFIVGLKNWEDEQMNNLL